MTIRLVIADDHPVVRDGLKYLVSQNRDMVLVGEAEDGIEAAEKIAAALHDAQHQTREHASNALDARGA